MSRYSSADELRADLVRFLQGKPVQAQAQAAAATPAAETTAAMPATDATRVVPVTTAGAGPQGPGRRTSAYVTLLLVLLAILAGGLFLLAHELGLGSSSAAEVTVPTVLQKQQDEATNILKGAGFKVKVTMRDDENDPAGTVADQDPKPDAKAHKGDTVTIFVSKGPPQVTVPNEIGNDVDAATNDLEQLGLTVLTRAQTSDKPEKQVLDQNPAAGTQVAKNSSITLTVSSGTGQATVPDVRGQDATSAANTLGQAGFKTTSKTQPSDTVPAGNVISTTPPGGAKATKGSTVTMMVSSGPSPTTTEASTTTSNGGGNVTVPTVVGETEKNATKDLQASNFNVASSNCPSPNSFVTKQTPAGGTSAPEGSTVSISC